MNIVDDTALQMVVMKTAKSHQSIMCFLKSSLQSHTISEMCRENGWKGIAHCTYFTVQQQCYQSVMRGHRRMMCLVTMDSAKA